MVMYNKGIAIVKSFRAYEKNRIIKVKLITYKHTRTMWIMPFFQWT